MKCIEVDDVHIYTELQWNYPAKKPLVATDKK